MMIQRDIAGRRMARPLLLLLLLTACDRIPGTDASLEREARMRLQSVLFDNESARFQALKAGKVAGDDAPEGIICGEVNAKNRMGAYVGFRRFAVSRENDFAAIDPQAATEDEMPMQAGFDAVWKDGCS